MNDVNVWTTPYLILDGTMILCILGGLQLRYAAL
jgi:hypothetical protein